MIDSSLFSFIVFILISIPILLIIKDLFAPLSFAVAICGLFFMDIFLNNYDLSIHIVYLIILLSLLLTSGIYFIKNRKKEVKTSKKNILKYTLVNWSYSNRIILIFWILSIPALLSQLYLINMFGGIFEYAIAAKIGTKEFSGLGPLKTIINTIYPVATFYYVYILIVNTNTKQKIIFLIYFSIVLTISLLLLSRGTLVGQILTMIIIYHLIKSRLSLIKISTVIISLLLFVSIYGVVRENFKLDSDGINLGLATQNNFFKSEWTEFGVFPLEKVLANVNIQPSYGMTYITVFTNFVPRIIWPEKPDPGGVVFTRDYAPGLYDEYNQYTTGIFPEAIINFGKIGGIIFGFIQLLFSMLALSYMHLKYFNKKFIIDNPNKIFYLLVYVYCLQTIPFMITGEFTNMLYTLIVKIITVYFVFIITRKILFRLNSG
jgi:oligosaccharide repeat unit polymerase